MVLFLIQYIFYYTIYLRTAVAKGSIALPDCVIQAGILPKKFPFCEPLLIDMFGAIAFYNLHHIGK